MTTQKKSSTVILRPPIVTILGHVDHGKTTLLDTIRKTNLAAKEYGGITQHIGAYQIDVPQGKITFIDTPGHEAFAKMRARGAKVADIAILVVAGNDGVMPQTIESIQHIKAAKIPAVVAINKIDLSNVNLEKVKKQLVKAGVSVEEYGGDTPVVPVSAKKGQGIDKLLQMILLLAELYQAREEDKEKLEAVVIESSLSKNKGPIATVVLRGGKINQGVEVVCEDQAFRVKAIYDWKGDKQDFASAGDPIEILGWKHVPLVGSVVVSPNQPTQVLPDKKEIIQTQKPKPLSPTPETEKASDKVKFIIKADTAGSLETITLGLGQAVEVIASGVGNITESDVLLAKTTKAIVIGFNIKPPAGVWLLAQSEKVIIKTYSIIYELFKELEDVVEAVKQGNLVSILGEAKVVAIFNVKKSLVAGVKVVSGRIARGDQVKIMRGEKELIRTRIKSLRHLKEDITKADQGMEAGVVLNQTIDILTGDSIISIG